MSAVKSDHLAAATLLTAAEAHPAPGWQRPQPPAVMRVLAPVNERDSVKVSGSLAALAEGDSALTVTQDPATGGALVGVQGPLHLRVLRQRLKDAFGLEVEEVLPSPAYRETISKSQETAYRHKKQTGGAGQFADVKLIVAPGARGAGFVFDEVVKGGAVPRNYIPAVETGARDAMERGPLGFPVVDVAVTLTDGQAHSVDSSDMAFRIAGRQGTREALRAAGPVLLQPVFRIAIHAPAMFTGSLGPIVASHAGQVLGFDADRGRQGLGALRGAGAGGRARRARERRAGGDAGGRLVRAGVRPLRGAARQGGGADRAGAGEGAGVREAGFGRGSRVNGVLLDAHIMHGVCTRRMHARVAGPKGLTLLTRSRKVSAYLDAWIRDCIAALSALGHETRLEVFRLRIRAGADGVIAGEIGGAARRAAEHHVVASRHPDPGRADQEPARGADDPLLRRPRRRARPARLPAEGCCRGRPELCHTGDRGEKKNRRAPC